MGGSQCKDLQYLLTALPSCYQIGSEIKQQMRKYLVRSERNWLVASYTRYNTQAGQEDAEKSYVEAFLELSTNFKSAKQTNTSYYEIFKSRRDTVKAHGGQPGYRDSLYKKTLGSAHAEAWS